MIRRLKSVLDRTTGNFQLWLVAIGGILTFSIVFKGQTNTTISHLERSALHDAIVSGPLFKGSSLVALALATPLYIDIVFDWANAAVSWVRSA